MARDRDLHAREPRPVGWLRQAARVAAGLPVAGDAVRHVQDTEDWALIELKQRLDALDKTAADDDATDPGAAAEQLKQLLSQSLAVDPAVAKARLYHRTLSQLVPDQAAMLARLAERGRAPLCHVAAARFAAGRARFIVLANASSLGRDAGVLLRDHVPHYMGSMLQLGLFEVGPEDHALAAQYERLQADTLVRHTMDRVRSEMKMHPRFQRFSVTLSDFGHALWRDCQTLEKPAAQMGDPS